VSGHGAGGGEDVGRDWLRNFDGDLPCMCGLEIGLGEGDEALALLSDPTGLCCLSGARERAEEAAMIAKNGEVYVEAVVAMDDARAGFSGPKNSYEDVRIAFREFLERKSPPAATMRQQMAVEILRKKTDK